MKNPYQFSNRIPRIKGLTLLSRRFIISNEDKDYYHIIHHVINHYIQYNFTYLGTPITLPQLSLLTNIREEVLQDQVTQIPSLYSKAFSLDDPQKALDLRQRLISDVFQASMSDKALIGRLNSLLSNDLTYPDPRTGAPKVALKTAHLLVKSVEIDTRVLANLVNLVDKLMPQSQLSQLLAQKSTPQNEVEYITITEAVELISDQAQLSLSSPDRLRLLAEKHGLDEVPEVRASGSLNTDGTFIKSPKKAFIPEAQETILYSIDSIEDGIEDIEVIED